MNRISAKFVAIFLELSKDFNALDNVIANRCKVDIRYVNFIRNAINYDKEAMLEIYTRIINDLPMNDLFSDIPWEHNLMVMAHPSGLIYSKLSNDLILGSFDKNSYMVCHARYVVDGQLLGKSFRWHRLIAMTFIDNPDNKDQINHLDGNKLNNAISNLEWCTALENCQHKVLIGLQKVGEESYQSIYTSDQIEKVCRMLEKGIYSPKKIELVTGVNRKAVTSIRNRHSWKSISKKYVFPKSNFNVNGQWIDDNGVVHGDILREIADQHKYSDNQIREACRMKSERYRLKDIEKKTGVSIHTIARLGGTEDYYRHISKDFVFGRTIGKNGTICGELRKFSDDQVRKACELMMDPNNTIEDVCAMSGMSRRTIRRFHTDLDSYPEVTKDYVFPKYRKGLRGVMIESVYR